MTFLFFFSYLPMLGAWMNIGGAVPKNTKYLKKKKKKKKKEKLSH